jgi:hypothetical protein
METKDAAQAFSEIAAKADEAAINSARVVHKMGVGQTVRQGDIYLHRVKDGHAHGRKLKSRQLALGNTMGSRHMAGAPATVYDGTTLPEWCDRRTFMGPLIMSVERFTVTHPEHAHVELPPGCYQVTHQMDARTMERVRD